MNGEGMEIEHSPLHRDDCERGRYLVELSDLRNRMSALHFRQLYGAEWLDWSALPAYTFDRGVHVTDEVREDPHLPLDLACDFNVDPMAWIVGQHTAREAWALDEIAIPGGATTEQACQEFLRRYPGHNTRELQVYGDAAGKSRSTKSTETDYQIIRQVIGAKWPRLVLRVPDSNGPVTDRLNAVNAVLRSGSGLVRYYMHPRCEKLADDFARVGLKPGTRELDKRDRSRTHFTDAEGYRLLALFPIAPVSMVAEAVSVDPFFRGGIATQVF